MRAKQPASQKEAGWRDALAYMLVTELTFQLDRSELKEEAELNTSREESVRAKEQASGKPKGGWAEGRTVIYVGDGADVPARQVGIEGGGFAEHCAREARWTTIACSQARAKRRPHRHSCW